MNYVVKVENVTKTYVSAGVEALRGVSLEVPEKAFLALAGPSGSGKTTLLNLIGALDSPTSGSITIIDSKLESLSEKKRTDLRRQKIGFVFQQFNLIPVLTAVENVELALEIIPGFTTKQRREAAMKTLQLVGLEGMEYRKPDKLSGGQQQRVAIARALVKEPAIVIADEPTANLDGKTGAAIIDLMKRMRDEAGTAFIFSTHDPRVIEQAEILHELVDGRLAS